MVKICFFNTQDAVATPVLHFTKYAIIGLVNRYQLSKVQINQILVQLTNTYQYISTVNISNLIRELEITNSIKLPGYFNIITLTPPHSLPNQTNCNKGAAPK